MHIMSIVISENNVFLCSLYHGCWRSTQVSSQVRTSHDIDLVFFRIIQTTHIVRVGPLFEKKTITVKYLI